MLCPGPVLPGPVVGTAMSRHQSLQTWRSVTVARSPSPILMPVVGPGYLRRTVRAVVEAGPACFRRRSRALVQKFRPCPADRRHLGSESQSGGSGPQGLEAQVTRRKSVLGMHCYFEEVAEEAGSAAVALRTLSTAAAED